MDESDHRDDEIRALRVDNARLRRLLDEAGLYDSLRHAFRDTMAMLRAVLRRTAETATDVRDYAAHLEGRFDAISRIRSRTDAFGEADLHSLASDILTIHLAYEGDRAWLSGPHVLLRPKAAQVLGLAMHELASNAVEHGPLGGQTGQVEVAWRVEPEAGAAPTLVLMWRETGLTQTVVPGRPGFGTAVLEEMLVYDLGAHTARSYGAEGLCCIIRLPLAAKIGRCVQDGDETADDDPIT